MHNGTKRGFSSYRVSTSSLIRQGEPGAPVLIHSESRDCNRNQELKLRNYPSGAPQYFVVRSGHKGPHDWPRLSKKETIMKPLVWKILLPVVACEIVIVGMLLWAISAHYIPPNWLAPGIFLFAVVATPVIVLAARHMSKAGTVPSLELEAKGPLDPAVRRRRIQLVWMCRVGLGAAVLAIVMGLVRARTHPAALQDVFISLVSAGLILVFKRRFQKGLD